MKTLKTQTQVWNPVCGQQIGRVQQQRTWQINWNNNQRHVVLKNPKIKGTSKKKQCFHNAKQRASCRHFVLYATRACMYILQLYHRHLASLSMIILPCKNTFRRRVICFENGNCFNVSALRNKTNDSERGDETKGKLLPGVDMLQWRQSIIPNNLVHCSRNRGIGDLRWLPLKLEIRNIIFFLTFI